ncbi:hypothetical protein HPB49_012998 [Dermacentor silvarum]|uniref:Uncharacterized protein n=1 Tax=Dermacentor silvarum TaxID=543639 RepID=A0ACB8C9D6_DERSI|nr:hypothetical protein HPB49_012998 [Dermacentor silvarum]
MSNFCAGCESGPKQSDPGYEAWKDGHQCQKNTDKKAGEMEVEAALILFRSLERYKLRYTTVLCDGDSRSYLALQADKVYGYIPIEKDDCVNHVQKRMGTALRNCVAKHRGPGLESLGGKGHLTGDLINNLSSYYGWALKTHKGDVDATQRVVMATYHHVTSNDNVANHTFCPTGPDSWCKQNAAKARVEAAVAEAVLKFNAGNAKASENILRELSLNPSKPSHTHMTEKDWRRAVASAKKREAAENLHQSLTKRHKGANSQQDYMHGAY